MDQEEIEALELTKEDLLAKIKAGRRVDLPRKSPMNAGVAIAAKAADIGEYVSGTAVIVGSVAELRLEAAFHSLPRAIASADVNLSQIEH